MQKCKNCSHVCAYHCAQLSYTTQYRAVLIIFSLILQTNTRVQMLSTGGVGVTKSTHLWSNNCHLQTDQLIYYTSYVIPVCINWVLYFSLCHRLLHFNRHYPVEPGISSSSFVFSSNCLKENLLGYVAEVFCTPDLLPVTNQHRQSNISQAILVEDTKRQCCQTYHHCFGVSAQWVL